MQKRITLVLLLCVFTGLTSAQQEQRAYNAEWPTVYTQRVTRHLLYKKINYGARIEPIYNFPQYTSITGIVRQIPVRVGQYVTVGTPLYSVQQVTPGAIYQAGWVTALNAGVVAEINVNVGERISAGSAVVTIADVSQMRANFYMNDRDMRRSSIGDSVYIADYMKAVDDEELKLENLQRSNNERLQRLGVTVANLELLTDDQRSIIERSLRQIENQRAAYEQAVANRDRSVGRLVLLPLIPEGNSGLFRVQVAFSRNAALTIGQFVTLELHVDRYEGLALWQGYVIRRYGQDQVRVVRNGRVEYQEVIIGDRYGEMVSILGGLEEDDEIITGSNRRYTVGDMVNVELRE
jgi:multidrug efflux pump subunit AcrA (membrane-fusion protein)